MRDIEISVIIPVYRAEKTLPLCLDSILSEREVNIEVICVDDGSDDKTPEVLECYAASDERISVIRQKNEFAGVARNRGIDAARGEFLTFMDADDLMLPGALPFMLREIQKHGADILKCGFVFCDDKTGEKYRTLYSMNSGATFPGTTSFKKRGIRLLGVGDMAWNGLYRRELLIKNHIRFNSLRQVNDHSFFIAALLAAERVRVVSHPTVLYRVGQDSSLVTSKLQSFENQIASYNIVREMVKELDVAERRLILEREICATFDWYSRIPDELLTERNTKIMEEFVKSLSKDDVGEGFYESFPFCHIYCEMRGGGLLPKRKSAFGRAISCYREHGIKYTVARLFGRENKKHPIK